ELRRIELGVNPIEERIAGLTNSEIEALQAEVGEISKRRTLLNHDKSAGETPEQKARNAELDAELKALAEEIKDINAHIREIRLGLLDPAERSQLEQLQSDQKAATDALKALPEPRWVYAAA